MTTVARHYADHLAPIYVWMAGGLDHAFALGAADLSDVLGVARYAVDLGAGFGMHAIPLARQGTRVLAIDSSELLLATLEENGKGLPVQTVKADLVDFASYLTGKPDLILCMGDTLTHLASLAHVSGLIQAIAESLRPGGFFLASFRDYRRLPAAESRFIPVRSDAGRIHTCFLEEQPDQVLVHDLVHERVGDDWTLRVSSYPKLRLDPEDVVGFATAAGLRCRVGAGPRGMLTLRADA